MRDISHVYPSRSRAESEPRGTASDLILRDRLVSATATRDPRTAEHLRRMVAVAGLLAARIGMPPSEARTLEAAAELHDVGKLTISPGSCGSREPSTRSSERRSNATRSPATRSSAGRRRRSSVSPRSSR
ncbi:MAG TPA: HD domain-containing protein [Solirubrobacterales bacterium]